jgi:hypothetical protein
MQVNGFDEPSLLIIGKCHEQEHVASALAGVALLLTASFAGAQQSGTAAEAKAMLERAVAAD